MIVRSLVLGHKASRWQCRLWAQVSHIQAGPPQPQPSALGGSQTPGQCSPSARPVLIHHLSFIPKLGAGRKMAHLLERGNLTEGTICPLPDCNACSIRLCCVTPRLQLWLEWDTTCPFPPCRDYLWKFTHFCRAPGSPAFWRGKCDLKKKNCLCHLQQVELCFTSLAPESPLGLRKIIWDDSHWL